MFLMLSVSVIVNAAEVVVDSSLTLEEALSGLSKDCPAEIRDSQVLISVRYWGFDEKIHEGQLLVHRDVVKDIQEIFEIALKNKFPIYQVRPFSLKNFYVNGIWSDDESMAQNNTSAFNYRTIAGTTRLSNHAWGRAIDINPVQNPYVRDDYIAPPNAVYDKTQKGTLTGKDCVSKAFLERGWIWGGNWQDRKDYQHFEKPISDSSLSKKH